MNWFSKNHQMWTNIFISQWDKERIDLIYPNLNSKNHIFFPGVFLLYKMKAFSMASYHMNNYFSCPFERFTARAGGTNNGLVFVYTTHLFFVVLVYNKLTFLAILITWSFCWVDCWKKKQFFLILQTHQ